MTTRHEYLINAYCSGNISDAEFSELEGAMRQNADFRKTFLEHRMLETSLRNRADAGVLNTPPPQITENVITKKVHWQVVLALAAGIAILLTGAVYLLLSDKNNSDNKIIEIIKDPAVVAVDDGKAIIIRELDARWKSKKYSQGDAVPEGLLKLTEGWVELQFYSGTKVILEGPVEFHLLTENSGFLYEGKCSAYVPSHAHGFSIETVDAKIVDLGTSFGVIVDPLKGTTVSVLDGEVLLVDYSSESNNQKLSTGMATFIKKGKKAVPIKPQNDAFLSALQLTARIKEKSMDSLKRWEQRVVEAKQDTSLLASYKFTEYDEFPGRLQNLSSNLAEGLNGSIIGAQWSEGRWPGKKALDFKRPGDCVRINVPGKYQSVTASAWVRLDGFDVGWASLVLSDGWERTGAFHWQLNRSGFVELAVYITAGVYPNSRTQFKIAPSDLGRWMHLAVVYDGKNKEVIHYRNGVASKPIKLKITVPIDIGAAQIGNWNDPKNEIRNFNGRMDDVALYTRAFSTEEVLDLYKLSKPQ